MVVVGFSRPTFNSNPLPYCWLSWGTLPAPGLSSCEINIWLSWYLPAAEHTQCWGSFLWDSTRYGREALPFWGNSFLLLLFDSYKGFSCLEGRGIILLPLWHCLSLGPGGNCMVLLACWVVLSDGLNRVTIAIRTLRRTCDETTLVFVLVFSVDIVFMFLWGHVTLPSPCRLQFSDYHSDMCIVENVWISTRVIPSYVSRTILGRVQLVFGEIIMQGWYEL